MKAVVYRRQIKLDSYQTIFLIWKFVPFVLCSNKFCQ